MNLRVNKSQGVIGCQDVAGCKWGVHPSVGCSEVWSMRPSMSCEVLLVTDRKTVINNQSLLISRRSQWPRGLRRRSTAARLLGLWVRIPPGAWMSVCCECFVLSGRGLCES